MSTLFSSKLIYNIDAYYLNEAQVVTELCHLKHWPRKTFWVICMHLIYLIIIGQEWTIYTTIYMSEY